MNGWLTRVLVGGFLVFFDQLKPCHPLGSNRKSTALLPSPCPSNHIKVTSDFTLKKGSFSVSGFLGFVLRSVYWSRMPKNTCEGWSFRPAISHKFPTNILPPSQHLPSNFPALSQQLPTCCGREKLAGSVVPGIRSTGTAETSYRTKKEEQAPGVGNRVAHTCDNSRIKSFSRHQVRIAVTRVQHVNEGK